MKGLVMISGCFLMVLVIISQTRRSDAARILCVSHQFGSHMLMVHTIAEGLIEHGHEVYTTFSDRMPVPKGLVEKGFKILKYHTPEGSGIMLSNKNSNKVLDDVLAGKKQDMASSSFYPWCECRDIDNDVVLDKTIRNLQFDLLLVDMFPISSCLTFLSLKYGLPFVAVPPLLDIEIMRTPILPSFIPGTFMVASDDMTFSERLRNTAVTVCMAIPAIGPFTSIKDTALVQKYSKDPDVTTWKDVNRKAELFLITRGPILEFPAPLTPNIINIECLTCKPAKPLEPSVNDMIEQAEGVIVVSFGSLISHFPDHVADKFLKAFAQRKEIIFWRYTGKFNCEVPKNVNVMKWLPQNDLLAHPKTKLFITHSGNNGQYESVYHGIPMLAFPLFAEQPHNAFRIVKHGYGLMSDISTFTTEELTKQMAEIIENPSYREKTQKASRILKSSPMDAVETSVYWIEHVLEFGGDHLRSHALKMPWYSFYMIDILIVVQITLVVLVCLLVVLCKWVTRAVCGTKAKVKTH